MKKKLAVIDRIYKLKNSATPLSYTLPSRNTNRFPLMYWDEQEGVNRPLRYAINQKSPFEDEQDGNAILQPIIFENGFLRVPKNNPVLQEFLYYHPLNGHSFVEVDHEKDASRDVERLDREVDALIMARQLSIEQLENICRVVFGKDPSLITTAELKRDILIFAKQDPQGLLNIVNDPDLEHSSNVHRFFEAKLLSFRNNNKEVWINTSQNKRKMLSVPYGEDAYIIVGDYFKSDEGLEILKTLENLLEKI